MKIIGIHGVAGSGKDTVAGLLRRSHGCAQESFAKPLYEALSLMLGIPVSQLQDRAQKEEPIEFVDRSPRYLLQTLGTEWGRDLVGYDLWVRLLQRRIERAEGLIDEFSGFLPAAWVISDVRFEEEAEWVRKHGTLVHLIRDNAAPVIGHVSELGVEYRDCDMVLSNNGTLDDLRAAVTVLASDLRLPILYGAQRIEVAE